MTQTPAVVLDAGLVDRVRHGQDVGPFPDVASAAGDSRPENPIRLLDAEGRLIALAKPAGERGFLHASVVFG
jgi:hypothetical protein